MKSGLVLPVFLAAIPSDYLSRLLQRGAAAGTASRSA
jgi:hypothetical protein